MNVILGDLDDFIAPAQSCINPIFTQPKKPSAAASSRTAASTSSSSVVGNASDARGAARLVIESDLLASGGNESYVPTPGKPDLIKVSAGNTAKVSLNDCLACSGCVTSAETVLISQQSTEQMQRALADPSFSCFIASFSPQALASLAAHFGIRDTLVAYRKLAHYFKHTLGFHLVVDTTAAADLVLAEACREFVERQRGGSGPPEPQRRVRWEAPPASIAVSSTHFQAVTEVSLDGVATAAGEPQEFVGAGDDGGTSRGGSGREGPHGPILASACPGWVCYAEKTVPEAIPLLSSLKSPQQVTGALLKQAISGGGLISTLRSPASSSQPSSDEGASSFAWSPDAAPNAVVPASAIYHVSVMPCYDKKLEASRRDFWWERAASSEVDCVVSAGEVAEMLRVAGIHLRDVPEAPRAGLYPGDAASRGSGAAASGCAAALSLEQVFTGVTDDGRRMVGPAVGEMSSDGYAEVIFRHAAAELHGVDLVGKEVRFSAGKNPDFREATLDVNGAPVLRFALAYGFRNIQTVVSRLRRGRSPWDYVEIMACPAGCANGGGQVTASAPVVAIADTGESLAAGAGAAEAPGAALLVPGTLVPTPGAGVAVAAVAEAPVLMAAAPAGKPALAAVLQRLQSRTPLAVLADSAPMAWLEGRLLSGLRLSDRRLLLHTRFHHIPRLETSAMKW